MNDMTINQKLIAYGGLIVVLGAGFIIVSGITAVLSKLCIVSGIVATSYGIYKVFND